VSDQKRLVFRLAYKVQNTGVEVRYEERVLGFERCAKWRYYPQLPLLYMLSIGFSLLEKRRRGYMKYLDYQVATEGSGV
jgi:hypothetical protein